VYVQEFPTRHSFHLLLRVPLCRLSNPFPSSTNAKTSPDPQPQTLPLRTPSLQLRPVVLFPLLSLPIPPLLSLLYLAAGYVILGQIYKSSSSSIYHTPILSSIEVGAMGGLIFSPVASILYLLIFYNKRPVQDDFFDDDSVITASTRYMTYTGYLSCALLLVGIDGSAKPLGVACLSRNFTVVIPTEILSTGAAATAGLLGGVVLSVGGLLLGILTVFVWSYWMGERIKCRDHTQFLSFSS
jgi:hypothetical protein